jgi:hypothetical protein
VIHPEFVAHFLDMLDDYEAGLDHACKAGSFTVGLRLFCLGCLPGAHFVASMILKPGNKPPYIKTTTYCPLLRLPYELRNEIYLLATLPRIVDVREGFIYENELDREEA